MIDPPGIVFSILGFTALAAALLPRLLGRAPVSMPMVFLRWRPPILFSRPRFRWANQRRTLSSPMKMKPGLR